MEIELKYYSGATKTIEVAPEMILDASIVICQGRMFVYEHSLKFRVPRFVETTVYTHGSC